MYLSLFSAVFIFISGSSFAQISMYIKALDNNGVILDGGSTAPGHSKEIEALAWSQGLSNCGTPSCPPMLQDFSFTAYSTKATITAKLMVLQGSTMQSVDVYFRKAGATFDYIRIRMENVQVSSVSEGGSGGEANFTVNITFSPKKIAWQFTAPNGSGGSGQKTQTGWNFDTNSIFTYNF